MNAGGLWSDLLQATNGNYGQLAFWSAVPQIILVNLLLSGDNAVVIALACRGLPPRRRLWGMALGAAISAMLLITFAVIVSRLMELPYVKLAGGLVLLAIAAKLLLPEHSDRDEIEAATHMWRAVRTIFVADFVMSLDNIVAVATLAQGNAILIAIGLAISIPVILAGAAVVVRLLDRFPILVWVGSGLLGWVAGETMATDSVVSGYLASNFGEGISRLVELGAAAAGLVLVLVAGGLWRRVRLSKAAGNQP